MLPILPSCFGVEYLLIVFKLVNQSEGCVLYLYNLLGFWRVCSFNLHLSKYWRRSCTALWLFLNNLWILNRVYIVAVDDNTLRSRVLIKLLLRLHHWSNWRSSIFEILDNLVLGEMTLHFKLAFLSVKIWDQRAVLGVLLSTQWFLNLLFPSRVFCVCWLQRLLGGDHRRLMMYLVGITWLYIFALYLVSDLGVWFYCLLAWFVWTFIRRLLNRFLWLLSLLLNWCVTTRKGRQQVLWHLFDFWHTTLPRVQFNCQHWLFILSGRCKVQRLIIRLYAIRGWLGRGVTLHVHHFVCIQYFLCTLSCPRCFDCNVLLVSFVEWRLEILVQWYWTVPCVLVI